MDWCRRSAAALVGAFRFALGQQVKSLFGFVKLAVFFADRVVRELLEWLFGGNALEPPLVAQFLVMREVEPQVEKNLFASVAWSGTLHFPLELFAEMKHVPPVLHLTAGVLRGFLVRAEVKDEIGLRHE